MKSMTTKRIILLSFLGLASLKAQYGSGWSEFNNGHASLNGGTATHAGVFSGWLKVSMQSANYETQQGLPDVPVPVIVPGDPILNIELVGTDVHISWPSDATGFVLEEKGALNGGSTWSSLPGPYLQVGDDFVVVIPASQASGFYRLAAP